MEIGVTFPQTELGDDPATIARFARRAEAAGFGHLLCYDHVLGANADREGGWGGPYDHRDPFHEPLVLYGYLAGHTDAIELVTGVLVLPQRQTALVAKQAAEVDLLSGGRLRLGVGVGWNPLEYVALGGRFEERGSRIEEQVAVLRTLWTENPTTFDGEYHELPDVGINPLPVQQPIPVWMGGGAEPVLRRVARQADGWIPLEPPAAGTADRLERIHDHAAAAGRDPDEIGVHGFVAFDDPEPDALAERVAEWRAIDADYLTVNLLGHDRDPDEHVAALDQVAATLADAGIDLA